MANKNRLCRCGCGEFTGKSSSQYKSEHKPKYYCSCGCGLEVSRQGAKARIHISSTYKKKSKPEVVAPLCACGCGETTTKRQKGNSYNKYIYGHQARGSNNSRYGKTCSEDTKRKISEATKANVAKNGSHWLGRKHSKETIEKYFLGENNHFYGKKHNAENMQKYREYTARMNSNGKQGPTRPERMVYEYFTSKLMEYVPEYPVKSYRADLFIPNYNLLIFVDGCWWHKCPIHCPDSPHDKPGDHKRDDVLVPLGYTVLTIWEHDVYERLDEVMDTYLNKYGKKS